MQDVERELATVCITTLRLSEYSPESLGSKPDVERANIDFFRYSALYWTSHLHDDDITEQSKLLDYILELYDTTGRLFYRWFDVFWKDNHPMRDAHSMKDQHAISIFGHVKVLDERYKRRTFDQTKLII